MIKFAMIMKWKGDMEMKGWGKKVTLLAIAGGIAGLFILGGCTDAAKTSKNVDADAIAEAKQKFQPLGEMPIPANNSMSPAKIALGETLFKDPRLSGNNTVSCMTCHNPGLGFSNGTPVSAGIEGKLGTRNSLSVLNAGYHTSFFWDGRAKTLEEQALGPIENPVEMDQNLDELIKELKGVADYQQKFKKVFNDEITKDNLAKAIAAYERTIVMDKTPFDDYLAGNEEAISKEAKQGMVLFAGKANCMVCHGGPTLSDNQFHNIGISSDDPGLLNVTKKDEDRGKFRTPQLRGLMYTAPFMHNGQFKTIKEVVSFYNKGGDNTPNQSEQIKPLNLTKEEEKALVAFLESLSGDKK